MIVGFLGQLTDCKRILYYKKVDDVQKLKVDTPWLEHIEYTQYGDRDKDSGLIIDTEQKYQKVCDSVKNNRSPFPNMDCIPPID